MIYRKFNDIISSKIVPGLVVDEVFLFKSLKEAFYGNAFSDIVHGSHGMVDFYVPGYTPSKLVRCEVGDLLIVAFNNNEIRYTLMQNKTMHKKKYFGTNPLTIPVKQHYVLANKPNIIPVGKSPYLHSSLLSSALLDSVGSYGVFYKTKLVYPPHSYLFNMNYMIANRLSFNSKVTPTQLIKKSKRKAKFIGEINNVVIKKGHKEIEACTNLSNFEYALRHMLIGTPVSLSKGSNNLTIIKIISLIIERDSSNGISDNQVRNNFLRVVRRLEIFGTEKDYDDYKSTKLPGIVLIDNTQVNENDF